MTVYHEKCSLHSPVEEKKKEIKSWDEEERDVHARQRNGIVISTWEGRREHGLLHGGGSLIKIFSIHFDPPSFSFFSPVTHFSHITTHPFPPPFPLSEKTSSQKKKKKKRKTKMTAMDPWRNNYPPWYTQNKPGEERTRAAILLSKFRRRGLARSISILK